MEYVLERPDVVKRWQGFTEHEFVAGLADGSLPLESFKYYLIQDYLFLVSSSQYPSWIQNLTLPDPICESQCPGGLQGEDDRRCSCGKKANPTLIDNG